MSAIDPRETARKFVDVIGWYANPSELDQLTAAFRAYGLAVVDRIFSKGTDVQSFSSDYVQRLRAEIAGERKCKHCGKELRIACDNRNWFHPHNGSIFCDIRLVAEPGGE